MKFLHATQLLLGEEQWTMNLSSWGLHRLSSARKQHEHFKLSSSDSLRASLSPPLLCAFCILKWVVAVLALSICSPFRWKDYELNLFLSCSISLFSLSLSVLVISSGHSFSRSSSSSSSIFGSVRSLSKQNRFSVTIIWQEEREREEESAGKG